MNAAVPPQENDPYLPDPTGIRKPPWEIFHREAEYDPKGFEILSEMLKSHFWYRERHRLLLDHLRFALSGMKADGRESLSVMDLGGGCGGWVNYLHAKSPSPFKEIALADSSLSALEAVLKNNSTGIACYQADIMNLGWRNRWDFIFLLDVIEHLPHDAEALRQVMSALKPGGFLFVTVPAQMIFWSYNDVAAGHFRRYSKNDLERLAYESGLKLVRARYFMFSLSPFILLRRFFRPRIESMTKEQIFHHMVKTHRTPAALPNNLIAGYLRLESLLGRIVPYPFGTSLLGIFKKE